MIEKWMRQMLIVWAKYYITQAFFSIFCIIFDMWYLLCCLLFLNDLLKVLFLLCVNAAVGNHDDF